MRAHFTVILLLQVSLLLGQAVGPATVDLGMEHPDDLHGALASASTKSISVKVMDIKTMEPIPFFTIDFTSCGHPVYESNERGIFSMQTAEGFACYVKIAKSGYADLDLLLDYIEIKGEEKTFNVFLSRSPNYFWGHLKDKSKRSLYLGETMVELTNLADQRTQRVKTSPQGEFALYLEPESTYQLSIRRKDYRPVDKEFRTGALVDPGILRVVYLEPLVTELRSRPPEPAVTRKEDLVQAGEGDPVYYSIQVLAGDATDIDMDLHRRNLDRYGKVYLDRSQEVAKVKVGKFFDQSVAKRIKAMIKRKPGYESAFLTPYVEVSDLPVSSQALPDEPQYMVRLASYLNPDLFDATKVAELGTIKSFKKGDWTIMLLEGYLELDEARKASKLAQEQGFRSAHVVRWDNKVLRRVHQ